MKRQGNISSPEVQLSLKMLHSVFQMTARSLLLAAAMLICSASLFAEGTDRVAPNATDVAFLLCDVNSYANFAEYGSSADNSLNIHLNDPETEVVYFGFSKAQTTPSASGVSQDFLFRVVDEFGTIVFSEMLIDTNSANIASHAQAVAGPNVPGIGTGYAPIIWNPAGMGLSRGDYRVEFARTVGNGAIAFEWWDITVAAAGEVKTGRIWSRQWAIAAGGGSFFNGEFFIYTEDQFVYNFNFAGSEFKPIWFSLFFNETGPSNTGDLINDRKSVPGRSGDPLYKIFINDPDHDAYVNTALGSINSSVVTGCSPGDYCIDIEASQVGRIEVLLDFDDASGPGIYDPGSADTIFTASIGSSLRNCIPWDGKDGLGNDVGTGITFKAYMQFKRGVANFPIYDVEFNRKGFNIALTRPVPTPAFSLEMYWDNTLVPDTADLADPNAPKANLTGCGGNCNIWTNKSFGDQNTINTWWEVQIDTVFDYSIGEFSMATTHDDSVLCSTAPIQLGGTIELSAGGTNDAAAVWATLSDGSFDDSLNINAIYTPSLADVTANFVDLVLYPNGCPGNSDTIRYTFTSPACAPLIVADTAETDEDIAITLDVIANDVDPYGLDSTSVSITTAAVHGSTSIDPITGSITYTPDTHYHGPDSLIYRICDTDLPVNCGSAKILLTVNPVNDAPVALNDLFSLPPVGTDTFHVLSNDADLFDPIGGLDLTTLEILIGPSQGTADTADNGIHYTPTPLYEGLDSIQYVICDLGNPLPSLCDTAWLFISVTLDNTAPVSVDDNVFTLEDEMVSIPILFNDLDDEFLDSNSVVLLDAALHGSAIYDAVTAQVVYTPNANYNGPDSLRYSVCDAEVPALCDTAWIFINVQPVNDPTLVQNDSLADFTEAVPLAIAVLTNDADPFDPLGGLDTASLSITILPATGTVSIDFTTGEIIYTSGPGFDGIDSFQYSICDLGNPLPSLCGSAWVICLKNRAPLIGGIDTTALTYCFGEETLSPVITAIDPDGDSLTATAWISSGLIVIEDSLSINIPLTRNWNSSTGTLTFGPGTPAEIQAALQSLSYSNLLAPGGETSGARVVSFQLNDGANSSNVGSKSIVLSSGDPALCDADSDGLSDGLECPGGPSCDADGDNSPNYLDIDSDGDGMLDSFEAGSDPSDPQDFDGDGTADFLDPDSDNDGIADAIEVGTDPSDPIDSDGDGAPDYQDLDSDADLIPDNVEAQNPEPLGSDADGDGIDDAYDTDNSGPGLNMDPIDTDGDGDSNYLDLDSDDDSLPDELEAGDDPNNPVDTDGDGMEDYIDVDSDNDGILDEEESTGDCNEDGIPNYIDADFCALEIVEIFTPNSDGINDALFVFGLVQYPDNEIFVFNRWGDLVFTERNYENDWEGISQITGEPLESGTYYYLFKTDYQDENSLEINGHTTIWR